jgi:hypothetical protein
MTTQQADTYIEMYVAPASTGVYDWHAITGIQRSADVKISRGGSDMSGEPGTPGWCMFDIHDPDRDFVDLNPMGTYYPSFQKGTQTRIGVLRVDSQFGTDVSESWGTTGAYGDAWTRGTSTGGTVSNSDWSVSSGTARHSLPVAGAYRLSELSKTTRPFWDCEAYLQTTVPTSNVTGSGALATEVWFRTVDVNNFTAVSVVWQTDETVRIAVYDKVAGTIRYLLNYTTISGLSVASDTAYDLRCQIEGDTVRARIWPTGDPEPIEWHILANDATVQEGYVAVADFAFSGNTNTYPLVFQHSYCQVRLMAFAGEVSKITPRGDGKSDGAFTRIRCADILERLSTPGARTTRSSMYRSRTTPRRWLSTVRKTLTGGDTRTAILPTSSLDGLVVGDLIFLANSLGVRKEDTQFTITGTATVGSDTHLSFTPDARDSAVSGDIINCFRPKLPTKLPIGYWPMEDGKRATQLSSGLVGGTAMSIVGTPDFATDSNIPSSDALLKLNDAEFNVNIPDYDNSSNALTVSFVVGMPDTDEAASGSDLLQFYTSGTAYSVDIQYTTATNGSVKVLFFNAAGTLLFDTGDVGLGLRGEYKDVSLVLEESGGAVTYRLSVRDLSNVGSGVGPTTVTGVTSLGKILTTRVNPSGGYDDVTFGHLTIVPDAWDTFATLVAFNGWSDRETIQRFLRLSYEEDIAFSYSRSWDVLSTKLGPQKSIKMIDLFKQGAESDGGFLIGTKGAVELKYMTRGSISGQDPRVTLDVSAGEIQPPFEPTGDYANVRNLVTVDRIDGGSASSELETGVLSTLAPPDGIGVRDRKFTLSLGSDTQAQTQADYRLGLLTVHGYRLADAAVISAGSAGLSLELLMSMDVGTRMDITGMADSKKIFDDLPQLILGYELRLGDRFMPMLTANCAPYDPFVTFALVSGRNTIGASATTTGSTLTTTATGSLTIVSDAAEHNWTTDSADFPQDIMISGERITIDGITGSGATQTANITVRSVNGVVKAHATGESVQIAPRLNKWGFR